MKLNKITGPEVTLVALVALVALEKFRHYIL